MKKLCTLILCLALLLCVAVIAQADDQPQLILQPDFDTNETIGLWDAVGFHVHSDFRNTGVGLILSIKDDPAGDEGWMGSAFNGLNNSGDAYLVYTLIDDGQFGDREDMTLVAKAFIWGENDTFAAESEPIEFNVHRETAALDLSAYEDQVTFTSGGGTLRQDGNYEIEVGYVPDVDYFSAQLFDADVEPNDRNWLADTYFTDAPIKAGEKATLVLPLARCKPLKSYTVKVFGFKIGSPRYDFQKTKKILIYKGQSTGDFIFGQLKSAKETYDTGEPIPLSVCYPNSAGLSNIWMQISMTNYQGDYELKGEAYQNKENGDLYYQFGSWELPVCYNSKNFGFIATVYQEQGEGKEPSVVATATREITVKASKGDWTYAPVLPAEIPADNSTTPFTLTLPQLEGTDFYDIGVWDEDDGEHGFAYVNQNDKPEDFIVEIKDVNRGVHVQIDAAVPHYNWYHYDTMIPVAVQDPEITIVNKAELTEKEYLIQQSVLIQVSAPGAEWIEMNNQDGWGDHKDGGTATFQFEPNRLGNNVLTATACFAGDERKQATVTIRAKANGNAGEFRAWLVDNKTSFVRGETATVKFTESENADHYWVDIQVLNGDHWDWVAHTADIYEPIDVDATAVIDTTILEPGTYRLCASAEGTGYLRAEAEITDKFTVTKPDLPDGTVLLSIEKTELETCERFTGSIYAPGANAVQIFWDYQNGTGWQNYEGGDSGSWNGQNYSHAGTYQIVGCAWFGDDEEPVYSDPVTVKVTAPEGDLNQPEIKNKNWTSSLEAGDEAEIKFFVTTPRYAEELNVEVWLNVVEGEDRCLWQGWSYDGGLDVSIKTKLEENEEVNIRAYARAGGYNESNLHIDVPVINASAAGDERIVITTDGSMGPNIPVHESVKFLVGPAEGHTMQAVKFFAGSWWSNGEEVRKDNHGDWFEGDKAFFWTEFNENYANTEATVYAMAKLDDEDEWVTSEIMTVQVGALAIGKYDFASTAPVTVKRGEDAEFEFTFATGADHYWVDVWAADNNWNSFNPTCTSEGTTAIMSTAQLPVGEYIVRGRAGKDGFGWREADSEVQLTITESDVAEGKVVFTVTAETVQTNENIAATIFAPGAEQVGFDWSNGYEGDRHTWNGDGGSDQYSWNNSGVYTVVPLVWYPEANDWTRGDPKTITVTSNGKGLDFTVNYPSSARAGDPWSFSALRPEGARNFDYRLEVEHVNDPENWEYISEGHTNGAPLEGTVSGEKLNAGDTIHLGVWTDAVGYEHNHKDIRVPVLGDANNPKLKIEFVNEKTEYSTSDTVEIKITCPHEYTQMRFYNGFGLWDPQEICEIWQMRDSAWFDQAGNYALYAELSKDDGNTWELTNTIYAKVVAPNGELAFDPSTIPETFVTNGKTDYEFTVNFPANAEARWQLREWGSDNDIDNSGYDTCAGPTTITLKAKNIQIGHTYQLNYQIRADGYNAIYGGKQFTAKSSLGKATAPKLSVPATVVEGDNGGSFEINVTEVPSDGWYYVYVFARDNDQPIKEFGEQTTKGTFTVSDLEPGDYSVSLDYNQENYDGGNLWRGLTVEHAYDKDSANWEWYWNGNDYNDVKVTVACQYHPGETITEWAEISSERTKKPTCTEEGERTYTAKVTINGTEYKDVQKTSIEKKNHNWGEPVWNWKDEEVTFTCADCSATETKGINLYWRDEQYYSCTEGHIFYCEGDTWIDDRNYYGSGTFSDGNINGNGEHHWNDPYVEWILGDDGLPIKANERHNCPDCDVDEIIQEGVAFVKKDGEVPATCKANGSATFMADVADGIFNKEKTVFLPKKDHTITYDEQVNEDGTIVLVTKCSACEEILETEIVPDHAWDEGTVATPATCSAVGDMLYTCKYNHEHTKHVEIPINPNAHKLTAHAKVEATQDAEGTEAYWSCDLCGKLFSDEGAQTVITAPVKIAKLPAPVEEPTIQIGQKFSDSMGDYTIKADGTAIFTKAAASAGATVTINKATLPNGQQVDVTEIDANAFAKNKKLKKVTIGPKIKKIGKKAFFQCVALKTVSGGQGLEQIMDSAFEGCKVLAKFTFYDKLTKIGKKAFSACAKLKTLTFKGTKAPTMGSNAFGKIASNAKAKVPAKALKEYSKNLKKAKFPKTGKLNNKAPY